MEKPETNDPFQSTSCLGCIPRYV